MSYKLHRALIGKSWKERDSIMNTMMKEKYKWRHARISYTVTPVQYYQDKYPYIDIYETYREKGKTRYWYTSNATRLFIIGEIFYYVYISNDDLQIL